MTRAESGRTTREQGERTGRQDADATASQRRQAPDAAACQPVNASQLHTHKYLPTFSPPEGTHLRAHGPGCACTHMSACWLFARGSSRGRPLPEELPAEVPEDCPSPPTFEVLGMQRSLYRSSEIMRRRNDPVQQMSSSGSTASCALWSCDSLGTAGPAYSSKGTQAGIGASGGIQAAWCFWVSKKACMPPSTGARHKLAARHHA